MEDKEKQLESELGATLQKNVLLSDHCYIGVGGRADFFYVADTIDDLIKAVTAAYKTKVPYFILGGGCNIIPSDNGFPGIVIQNHTNNCAFSLGNSQVIVDSGMPIGKLINLAASRDLGGLEFLFGIPGTVGGAVHGNAGAFGYEIGEFVKSAILLIPRGEKMEIVKKEPEWFEFKYRNSKLKSEYRGEKFPPVILTIKLQLASRRKDEILTLMQNNLKAKKASQPLGDKSPGSYFKNPGKTIETAAGYMLDQAGAKKCRVGGAAVSKKHANFIINRKNASADDIRMLGEKLKELVKEKFNYDLEEEVEFIGKW